MRCLIFSKNSNMGSKIGIFVVVITFFLACARSSEDYIADSLDAFLEDSAMNALERRRPLTGALYEGLLPANASGMEVSVVRLRSRRLWNLGANFSHFSIPPRTETVPHVSRLAIVYQDLGNWSSKYYSVPGYHMITSVVGFMVLNASNAQARILQKIHLDTSGNNIVIRFPDMALAKNNIPGARCAAFDMNGAFRLSGTSGGNLCHSRDQGHFAVVLPSNMKSKSHRAWRLWFLWLIGSILVLSGLGLVGYLWKLSRGILRTKKIQVMERQSDEDLNLENKWIGSSKMPSATTTRTQPTLDNGS